MLARAQRRSSFPDAAASTLLTVLGRDDLLAVARATRSGSRLRCGDPAGLARAGSTSSRLSSSTRAEQLRPFAPNLEHLAGLWLYRPQLIRETGGSTTAVIIACDEVISTLGDSAAAMRARRSSTRCARKASRSAGKDVSGTRSLPAIAPSPTTATTRPASPGCWLPMSCPESRPAPQAPAKPRRTADSESPHRLLRRAAGGADAQIGRARAGPYSRDQDGER